MSGRELPPGLVAAIGALLERRSRGELTERARRLSETYRAGRPTSDAIRDETDALAYALTRMPATYAATANALVRLRERLPAFTPGSILDVGCGLGAASCAANAIWPDLAVATLLDRSEAFLALARSIAAESGFAPLVRLEFINADLARLPEKVASHELVVASYAMTELADETLASVAAALWALTASALVIVEPGTPRDYRRLMAVRTRLVELGSVILAPCPHNASCPLAAADWCHFSVRLPRRRDHKLLKGADAPFEDEKFCYLIAARSGAPAPARILAPPRVGKAGTAFKLCGVHGATETLIPKRDKARYGKIRKKQWGDALDD